LPELWRSPSTLVRLRGWDCRPCRSSTRESSSSQRRAPIP
jgi:hypothetical protein